MFPTKRLNLPVILAALAALLLLAGAPALAQQNPPEGTCGLPLQGSIYGTVTYTLSSDCALTGELRIRGGATVTVNGANHTITSSSASRMFSVEYESSAGNLTLNSVTLNGQNKLPEMVSVSATLTANDVTVMNMYGQQAMTVQGSDGDVTLNRVLFENNNYGDFNTHTGAAIDIYGSPSVTLNKVVFRDNHLGAAAILISDSGTVTATNCLGIYGNIPWTVKTKGSNATYTNNSTGACTGTIGNGGKAKLSEPALLACGLPGRGTLYTSKTYTQTADCNFNTGNVNQSLWRITEGVTITINQSGNALSFNGGSGDKKSTIWVAGDATLNLNGARLQNVFFQNWGTVNLSNGAINGSSKHNAAWNWGVFNVTNSVVSNLHATSWAASVLNRSDYQTASATFKNVIFSNISGVAAGAGGAGAQSVSAQSSSGVPALYNRGSNASMLLAGCTSASNVLPALYNSGNSVTDNSVTCTAQYLGPELATLLGLLGPPEWDCLRLGAIGLICRDFSRPQAQVEIWGVNEDSSAYFIRKVTQDQVDAVQPGGLVTSAANGRVAVRVWDDRNITVQMGPTDEGKVHHVTLWHNLMGEVAGTIDTYGGPPGLDGLPAASGAAAGVHVVISGETLHDIALRHGIDLYALIELNKLADGGNMIYPGQKLRLPGSDGGVAAPAISDPAPLAKWVTAQEPAEDGSLVHVVQEGDTLWGVAVAYKMEPKTIMELNGFTGHGRRLWLSPGQRLLIRDGKTPPLAGVTNT